MRYDEGMDDFLYRDIPRLGKRVHRLGLAANYGIDQAGIEMALERGMNYVLWTKLKMGALLEPLRRALAQRREQMVVATGPSLAFFGGSVRRAAEAKLKELRTDYLDIFQLFWLGRMSAWTDATTAELVKLREEGKVRAIGVSIHDRERAGRLAEESPLDVFMIRYNAAHPGAERDIFPQLAKRRPTVIAYTATAWRKLLTPPKGWEGPAATAGDCYRFCLSSPHVDVVLCGPGSRAQLEENLAALEKGALSEVEMKQMRRLGKAAHG